MDFLNLSLRDSASTVRSLGPTQTGGLVYNSSQLVDLNILATNMATKQDTLTTGAGAFLSNNTLSGYGLRWNSNSTPTITLQDLHFDNYTVSETLNVTTGRNQLNIAHPTDMATQTWVSTQLATKQNLITGLMQAPANNTLVSLTHMPARIGLGTWTDNGSDATITVGNSATGQDHYKSPYVVPANSTITFSVDVKLGTATNVHMYWWVQASSMIEYNSTDGLNTSTFTTCTCTFSNTTSSAISLEWSLGRQVNHSQGAWMSVQTAGTLIVKNFTITTSGVSVTTLTGNLTISGTMTATTQSFDLQHPDPDHPEKENTYRLRHWCLEGDNPGGLLLYRREVEMTSTTQTFEMPPPPLGSHTLLPTCGSPRHTTNISAARGVRF